MKAIFHAMVLCLLAATPALAAPTAYPPGAAVATASVLVGGRQVALLGPAGGLTPQQRAQAMRGVLERAVGPSGLESLAPLDVAVATIMGAPIVTLRGHHLITATSTDALLAGIEPRALADTWARELRAGIGALQANAERAGAGGSVAIVPGTAVFQGGGAGAGWGW